MSIKSNNTKNGGSSKNHHKLRLHDSLLNMLGEFVALNKSPEVRLSKTSQQFLLKAVREEKLDFKQPRHVRSVSSNAALLRCPANGIDGGVLATPGSGIHHSRRISLPAGPSPPQSSNGNGRFNLLFPARMRKVGQADEFGRSELNNHNTNDYSQQRQQQQRQALQHRISNEVISESDEENMEEQDGRTMECIRM